jgi:predicted DNA-binding transcriptional regulator YafY
MLSEEETEAVLLGLRYVGQRGDEVLTKAAEHARAKISAVLSPEIQAATHVPTTIPGPDGKQFPDNAVPLALLRSAIRLRKRLSIEYMDGERRHTWRTIWPIQLAFADSARVLAGWCETRNAFRFFRTDRMLSAELGDRYPRPRAELVRNFHAQLQTEHSSSRPVP